MPDLGGMAGGADSDDEEGEESQVAPHTKDDATKASTEPKADGKPSDNLDDLDGDEVDKNLADKMD